MAATTAAITGKTRKARSDAGFFCCCEFKRRHMVGLELGISVASVGLRSDPTAWRHADADVVAMAKRDLAAGEMPDGEGGYAVFGKLVPAGRSVAQGGLPLGLAHHLRLARPVRKGRLPNWKDVAIDEDRPAVKARREMEPTFAPRGAIVSAVQPASVPWGVYRVRPRLREVFASNRARPIGRALCARAISQAVVSRSTGPINSRVTKIANVTSTPGS